MRKYDHFHAIIEVADQGDTEIEGGWSGPPPWLDADGHFLRTEWALLRICADWHGDLPIGGIVKLKTFQLAG